MTLPAEAQYKGTQTDEVIATPRPPRRFPSREEAGETILGKAETDTPLKTACVKLGAVLATSGGLRFKMQPNRPPQMFVGGAQRWGDMPQRGTLGAAALQQQLGAMPAYERLRMQAKMTGTPFTGLRRFGAKALGVASHPLGGMALGMGVPLAMRMIPAGRDEYGNRRSLADTGVGTALSTAAGLAPFAAPWLAGRLTRGVSALGSGA